MRERLHAVSRPRGEDTEESWDVVFVSLIGGGHGQSAAALTTLLSGSRGIGLRGRDRGSGQVDQDVRAVIADLGVTPASSSRARSPRK